MVPRQTQQPNTIPEPTKSQGSHQAAFLNQQLKFTALQGARAY
jgi:hypothetical protein